MTDLDKKIANLEELKERVRKDELCLELSQGKFQEAMQDLMKFLGYEENQTFSPFDLVKRSYQKGQGETLSLVKDND